MKLTIPIKQKVEIDLDIDDLLFEINETSLTSRFSTIASLINGIETEDFIELTSEQQKLIIDWLDRQKKRFTSF